MKKLFTFAMALLASAMMFAENRTVTINTVTAFTGQGTEKTGSPVSATVDGVTFKCKKGYATQYGLRCYTGDTIEISAGKENIVKITFFFATVNGTYYSGGLDTLQCVGDTDWNSGKLASQARIEGNIVIELGDGTCQPIVHDTLDLTVEEAMEIGEQLADGAETDEVYRVKAYVAKAYEWDSKYNNQNFYLSDDQQATYGDFYCKYTTGVEVHEGDFVSVTGKIEKSVYQTKTTIQIFRGVVEVLATDVENVYEVTKAIKFVENGQIVIIRNGVKYNTVGAVVK